MSSSSCILVTRHPYEEPYHLQLEISASNGAFSMCTDIYLNTAELDELGRRLQSFPRRVGDTCELRYGSDDPLKRFYRLFVLRAYTFNAIGHCAIALQVNQNSAEPNEGIAQFSIKAEAAAINRLGALFEEFARLSHRSLRWTPSDGELIA